MPDETLLVFCGYLIYKGKLSMLGTWAGGALGAVCGITGSYIIGRTLGLGFIHSRFGKWLHITDDRIHKVHDWFHRLGHWALVAGYFIPGVRHFTAIVAGTSCLEYGPFALFAYSGALLWVSAFIGLGYYFAEDWERMFEIIHRNVTAVTLTAAVLAGAWFLFRWYHRQRQQSK